MQAHFPPFTRTAARAEPVAPITDRESDLRTLKHYLYHAGLLVEKLLAPEQLSPLKRLDSGAIAADFTRDRDATGA